MLFTTRPPRGGVVAPLLSFRINVIPRVNIQTQTHISIYIYCIVWEMKEGTEEIRRQTRLSVTVTGSLSISPFLSLSKSITLGSLFLCFLSPLTNRLPNPFWYSITHSLQGIYPIALHINRILQAYNIHICIYRNLYVQKEK